MENIISDNNQPISAIGVWNNIWRCTKRNYNNWCHLRAAGFHLLSQQVLFDWRLPVEFTIT